MAFFFYASLLTVLLASTIHASPLDSWAEYPRPVGSGTPLSIVFGNGLFVAGGLNGSIITSANGVDWAAQESGTTGEISVVKYVNGRFFALGSETLVSENGADWTTLPSTSLRDITFAEGKYYGTSPLSISHLVVSTNLIDWEDHDSPEFFQRLTYANGIFVASTKTDSYQFSTDGQTWASTFMHAFPDSGQEITFQDGIWFTIRSFEMWKDGIYMDGVPISSFILSYSFDGQGWGNGFNYPTKGATFTPRKAAVGGLYYVFPTGDSIHYTTNFFNIGITPQTHWTEVNLPISTPETSSSDVAFGNNTFVAVTHGKIFKSNPVSGSAPLRISQHPATTSVNVGGTVLLSVLAQGSDPITYQWRQNGTNIIGANASSLSLTNVTFDSAGIYDVQITNPSGTVTSNPATLTIHFADVNFYAGVTLRGNPGDTFLIEYQNELDPLGEWHNAASVTLTSNQTIWIDFDSSGETNRFYRATFQAE